MSVCIVVGTHWGDEGKGRIVDYLSRSADVVVRAQGGNNAGHTVMVGDKKYVFHLIPSGVLFPQKTCILGDGMVIDPASFVEETRLLEREGVSFFGRLFVSEKAHIVMPYHRLLDRLYEGLRGKEKIGTTGRGVGPAYEDKVARWGIRVVDLLHPDVFAAKLKPILEYKNRILRELFSHPPLSYEDVLEEYLQHGQYLKPYVRDTSFFLYTAWREGKRIIIEGAQGTMLDLDHGTYPFVTSSYPVASGALLGAGLGPCPDIEIIGVCKAYTSRVGEGPFPTELKDDTGVYLRERGGEYGATTGRPRRCGWLDGVVLKYAARVNNITSLVLTKLDVLQGLPKIRWCYAYEVEGEIFEEFPMNPSLWTLCRPLYQEFEGWNEDISSVRSYKALPRSAQNFVESLEDFLGIPVVLLSVGPRRDDTIVRREIW
ncbi:MAG: adenylosuccinate synthase [Candidatus Caldatribacteriaceae bacterium]